MKLELPRFDGNDPYGWTFRVQEYFDFHETADEQRMRIVSFNMEGKASDWYQWMKVNKRLTTWKEFLIQIKMRFGPSQFEDPTGKLAKLMQKGNVEDYQAEFETLMNKVEGVTEQILISIFIAGLKNEIQQDLLVARPTTLDEAFSLSRLFESRQTTRHLEQRVTTRWPGQNSNGQVAGANVGGEKSISQCLASQIQKAERVGAKFKRLTSAEMRDKRARGECFNCDQKWTASHKCTRQFLLMIEYPDEEEENLESDGEGGVITGDVSSLQTLAGAGNPRSLRMWGRTSNTQVHVLIDSGSTHNFMHPDVAERLQLPLELVTPFRVYIGNGDSMSCRSFCPPVKLELQGAEFIIDLLFCRSMGRKLYWEFLGCKS
ncbi:Unknown protein [Striga hermonthica]|uniref:Retrotransposon gag domain-containing protein n=1 Tax=Striga hermonthica TaxID=68872 RepID=A0A9N7MJW5_STRHE|nr:Unknown protein [Striga hermonthica]